jgi:competence ComEA-like helix-hairpin-helix protein
MWKDFFYFSKRERQGILILIALIAGIFIGKFLFTPKVLSPIEETEGTNDTGKGVSETERNNKAQNPFHPSPAQKPTDAYPRQNRQAEKRTYYQQAEKPDKPVEASKQDIYPKIEKLAEGTVIELNASDTTQLMKIPGIGPAFARRITSYRNNLGGFYRKEQLQEVYGMYEELYEKISPFIKINLDEIITIQANAASIDKLKSHPYLNFYQAKAIVEMRKKKGKLENISDLSLLEEFTEDDLEKIKHYLAF